MALKICLSVISPTLQENFSERMAAILGMKATTMPVKEKRYAEDTMARFRRNLLTKPGHTACKVEVREGILVKDVKLYPLREVIVTYEPGKERLVHTLLLKLVKSKESFVLKEPSLRQRFKSLQSRETALYGTGRSAARLARVGLLNQIYAVNEGWAQLLQNQEDKLLIRQLRVKLRRLRSCLVFFKHMLPDKQTYLWQRKLRAEAELLSVLRELDVAMMSCSRMRRQTEGDVLTSAQHLEQMFWEKRQATAKEFFLKERLQAHTLEGIHLYLWLQDTLSQQSPSLKEKTFVKERLTEWINNLQSMTEKHPDFHNMEDLHKIRIKVKRFRYVVQTLGLSMGERSILRHLKQLQDMLGFLHDNYVNAGWARSLLEEQSSEDNLVGEVSAFLGWEHAKAEAAIDSLPQLWKTFLEMLEPWDIDKIGY
jgi:CHAD domain-containing protein